jgi:hypothetical protein
LSKISLTGNASGTGTFTIASPDSNSDRTLNLPDNSGTVLTSATTTGFPAGSVIQVVSATHGTQVSSSTDTFVDTGLTASITPTSATSKILVIVNQAGCEKSSANSASSLDIRLLRNSTNILTFAGALAETNTAIRNVVSAGACLLDSPATTSSVTYKTDFRSRNNTASVSVQYANISTSSIVLMEIAA